MVTNDQEGIIAYSYSITDGTASTPPRLKASLQFDELFDVDKVMFRLRQETTNGYRNVAPIFNATKTAANTWQIDEPLLPNANGAPSDAFTTMKYYLNNQIRVIAFFKQNV